MSLEELQQLIEIALRGASQVEKAWIKALVERVNAQPQPAPEQTDHPLTPSQ